MQSAVLSESAVPAASPQDRRAAERHLQAAYAAHKAKIYAVALRYGAGDQAFAEDVLQDVFVKLWHHLPGLADPHDVGGWLYRVATNECLQRLRKRQFRTRVRRFFLIPEEQSPDPSPHEVTDTRQRAAQVFAALADVDPKARVAFCAVHLDGLTLVEVGAMLGHSKGYISKLVKKAQQHLQHAAQAGDTP